MHYDLDQKKFIDFKLETQTQHRCYKSGYIFKERISKRITFERLSKKMYNLRLDTNNVIDSR